jgi:hypothetical protein
LTEIAPFRSKGANRISSIRRFTWCVLSGLADTLPHDGERVPHLAVAYGEGPGLPAAPSIRSAGCSVPGLRLRHLRPAPRSPSGSFPTVTTRTRTGGPGRRASGRPPTELRQLDADHNGALSFQDYAVEGIEKFNAAGVLEAELSPSTITNTRSSRLYRPGKRKAGCSCGRVEPTSSDRG